MGGKYFRILLIFIFLVVIIGFIYLIYSSITGKVNFQQVFYLCSVGIASISVIIAIFNLSMTSSNIAQQSLSIQKQYIENHFFSLLDMHEKYKSKLEAIDNRIFSKCLLYVNHCITFLKQDECYRNLGSKELLTFAYLSIFLRNRSLVNAYLQQDAANEESYQKDIFNSENWETVLKSVREHMKINDLSDNFYSISLYNKLGLYFRQLYQIVCYIDDQKILSYAEKCSYIKTLRSQIDLSQQYLIFINSLTLIGYEWEMKFRGKDKRQKFVKNQSLEKQLITKYNLLKNIPKGYSPIDSINIDVEDFYPNIDYDYHRGKKSTERLKLEKIYQAKSKVEIDKLF